MSTANVVDIRSRKRDRDHVNSKQHENNVVHESFDDGGGGPPPIVVNVILKLPDDVVEENESDRVKLETKPVVGFWTALILGLTVGFSI